MLYSGCHLWKGNCHQHGRQLDQIRQQGRLKLLLLLQPGCRQEKEGGGEAKGGGGGGYAGR